MAEDALAPPSGNAPLCVSLARGRHSVDQLEDNTNTYINAMCVCDPTRLVVCQKHSLSPVCLPLYYFYITPPSLPNCDLIQPNQTTAHIRLSCHLSSVCTCAVFVLLPPWVASPSSQAGCSIPNWSSSTSLRATLRAYMLRVAHERDPVKVSDPRTGDQSDPVALHLDLLTTNPNQGLPTRTTTSATKPPTRPGASLSLV